MPNLTAMVGLLLGLVALFVNPELGTRLIAVYLVFAGLLRLISPDNAAAMPQAPRRAAAAPAALPEDEYDDEDEAEPVEAGPMSPADAYRTFTPDELKPKKRATHSPRKRATSSDEEDNEE